MDIQKTGLFLAELRKQKGYTQKELAEKLMVTDKAVSRWETGRGLPDTSLLKALSDFLTFPSANCWQGSEWTRNI